jgi:site-specific DNA recombinase
MPSNPRKTIGYVRCSHLEQTVDRESLRRQEEQIRAFCTRAGIAEFELIVDEGYSGYKDSRPGFKRLLKLCKANEVERVLVYDLSRLSRSVRTTLAVIEDIFHGGGIEFVALQNQIDTSTPMGKAFLTFIALFNQLYRDAGFGRDFIICTTPESSSQSFCE